MASLTKRRKKPNEHCVQPHKRRLTKLAQTAHVAIHPTTRPDPLDLSASSPEQGAMTTFGRG
jgi:DNA topoisomerase IA